MLFYLIGGVAGLFLLLLFIRSYVNADPRTILNILRYILGIVAVIFGGALAVAGRVGLGIPVIVAGLALFFLGRVGPIDLTAPSSGGSGGRKSSVSSNFLEMELDHNTGEMTGRVIGGTYAGRQLDDMDIPDLKRLSREISVDAESLSLLEAYLDRRMPGWREDVDGDEAAGAGGTAQSGTMTDEEAYQILGLSPGASESEIWRAYRELMKAVHPDRGGSTFLAAKINGAKDWLLRGHR